MSIMAYLVVGILIFALVAWIYFDATELNKPAIGWALAVASLGWLLFLPVVLYLIFRDHGRRRIVAPGGARRQAPVIASLTGLTLFAFGLSVLLGASIAKLTDSSSIEFETYHQLLALSFSSLLVGGVTWGAAWALIESRLSTIDDADEYWGFFYIYRAYLYTVIGLGIVQTILSSVWLLGGVWAQVFGGTEVEAKDWTWAAGALAVGAVLTGLHYMQTRSSKYNARLERFTAIEPPPVVGSVPGPSPVQAKVSG